MTKFIGLDVHVKKTVACIINDRNDFEQYETVKTSPVALKRLLKRHSGEARRPSAAFSLPLWETSGTVSEDTGRESRKPGKARRLQFRRFLV